MPVSIENLANLVTTLLLVLALWQVGLLRQTCRATTAEPARWWAVAALVTCIAAELVRSGVVETSLRTSSALRYFAAVMLLTPLIAVLGARRPGVRAWPWFVVLPLILVLQWPSVSQLMSGRSDLAIEIPTPTAIGFLLVLVMGAGNYIGTLNTMAALMGGLGTLVVLARAANWGYFEGGWPQPLGACLLLISAVSVRRRFRRALGEQERSDRVGVNNLWIDFRDLFGIVWARRVVDRVNQFSKREKWDVQLTLDGFVRTENPQANKFDIIEDVPERAVEILCWVLRRFVDLPFLRRYLPDVQSPYSDDSGDSVNQ